MGLPSLLRQPQGDWREMVQNSGSCQAYKTEVAPKKDRKNVASIVVFTIVR